MTLDPSDLLVDPLHSIDLRKRGERHGGREERLDISRYGRRLSRVKPRLVRVQVPDTDVSGEGSSRDVAEGQQRLQSSGMLQNDLGKRCRGDPTQKDELGFPHLDVASECRPELLLNECAPLRCRLFDPRHEICMRSVVVGHPSPPPRIAPNLELPSLTPSPPSCAGPLGTPERAASAGPHP